jgi:hypothetical protein
MNNINSLSKLASVKIIEGQIADASGHTDFRGNLDEAVDLIMENVKKHGKWAYVNGNPFVFERYDDRERAALLEALDSVDQPHFVLTGKLQGGRPQPSTIEQYRELEIVSISRLG